MTTENKAAISKATDEIYPYKPATPPAIGSLNLEQLRQMYGDSYGTSGNKLVHATPVTDRADSLKLMTWENLCRSEDTNPKELMEQGVTILHESFADYNSLRHLFGQYDAKWAIKLGGILINQKKLVRKAGLEWGEWAAQNLPFIGKRTREKFMNLAKRRDCHQYSFLGVDRLDVLCSATKESDDENESNRIGAFMTKYEIEFDPTQEFDPQEFKTQVDTALNRERLIGKGLPADPVYVRDLTVAGKEINGSIIKKMKDIQECGGDPEAYLKNLTLTSGQSAKDDDEGETTVIDFNNLSNRLIRTIDYLIKDKEDEIVKVDPGTFEKLLKKLEMLQKLAPVPPKTEQAA